jgi:hypothetical protein
MEKKGTLPRLPLSALSSFCGEIKRVGGLLELAVPWEGQVKEKTGRGVRRFRYCLSQGSREQRLG